MKKRMLIICLVIAVNTMVVGCGNRRQSERVTRHKPGNDVVFYEVARSNFKLESAEDKVATLRNRPKTKTDLLAEKMVAAKVAEVVCTFSFDDSELTKLDKKQLDKAFTKVAPGKLQRVEIEGHCCNIGEDDWNDGLSNKRAEAVAEYLERDLNVPRAKMVTLAYGEARPKHPNDTAAGRSANRRCEVVIVYQGEGGLTD